MRIAEYIRGLIQEYLEWRREMRREELMQALVEIQQELIMLQHGEGMQTRIVIAQRGGFLEWYSTDQYVSCTDVATAIEHNRLKRHAARMATIQIEDWI